MNINGISIDEEVGCLIKLLFRFGIEVTDAMMTWTKGLCANMSQGWNAADYSSNTSESRGSNTDLSSLSVLDIGTGNGLLLQEFAKQGNFPGVYLI